MQEINKFKLGLFTLSAIAVFLIFITLMGMFDKLQPKAQLFTIVEESVQGLSNGSAVRYKGVPIGNISDILILTDSNRVQINFEVDLSKFRKRLSDSRNPVFIETQAQFYTFLQPRISKGLCCRIEPDGITGSKYIEVDFFPDAKICKLDLGGMRSSAIYLPSTPSMMSNLRMSALEILASIAAVDFKGISTQLTTLLTSVNKTLQNSRLNELTGRINQVVLKLDTAVQNLNQTIDEKHLGKLMQSLGSTIRSVEDLSKEIRKTVQASAVPALSEDARNLTLSLEASNRTLQQTLQKANDALDAMTDLIRYVNENPSSVLRGRGKQTDPFREK